jgi:hypothetical protein
VILPEFNNIILRVLMMIDLGKHETAVSAEHYNFKSSDDRSRKT